MSKIIFFAAIALVFSCSKMGLKEPISKKLEHEMENFKSSSYNCMDATIDKYILSNDTVFVFETGTCYPDDVASVFNTNGEELGGIGGKSGNFKINNVDFSTAQFLETTWHK